MKRSSKRALVLAAATTIPMVSQAIGANLTWTGAVPDPNSATYTLQVPNIPGLVAGQNIYNFNGVANWSSGGSPVNYTVGDSVFISDAVGDTPIRVTAGSQNPANVTFYHDGAGSATTDIWLMRGDEFAAPGPTNLSSNTLFNASSTSVITLDTGFLGTVHIRSRAVAGTSGNTIIRGGTLEIHDALALPGSNPNAPSITLDGGTFSVFINGGGNTNPASTNINGAINVISNSMIALNSPNNSRVLGNGGSLNINAGVTLTMKSLKGFNMNTAGALVGTGTLLLADADTGAGTITSFTATGNWGGSNLNVDLGVGNSTLTVGNANFGALYGGANTRLAAGAANTISVGGLNVDSTFNGVMTAGNLNKVGTASLTLTNNNTHTSATNSSGGVLVLAGANGAASATGSVNLTTGGTLRLDNAAANNDNRLNDAAAINMNQGNLVFVGNLAAPTSETAGTLNIVGAANNVTALSSGVGGPAAINFAALNRTGGAVNFETAAGTNINFTTAPTPINGIIGGYATANGGSWAGITGNTVTEYVHSGGETNTAPGTWTNTQNINLTAGGSPSVAATASVNTLRLNSTVNVGIAAGQSLKVEGGGILAPGTFNPTISGPGSLTSGTGAAAADLYVQVPQAANTLTINSPIADNGATGTVALVKLGAGKLVLGGAQSYTGGLSIGGGTVATGAANIFTSGTLTIDFGNTFDIGGFNQAFTGVVLINGTLDNTGGAATVSSGTFDVRNGTVKASLGGAGGLTKSTGGSVSLGAANTYSGGTNVSGGTLIAGVAGALPSGGSVSVTGGALSVADNSYSLGTMTITGGSILGTTGVITSTSTFEINGGAVSAILGGSSGLTKDNSANTATLSGLNTYTGVTSVNAGTLAVNTLVNGGLPSAIGQSSNAAANLVLNGGGTLNYTGVTTSTDRQLTVNGDAAIFSSGASITFSSTAAVQGNAILTLGGGNTGQNLFNPAITGGMGLAKVSGGLWRLGQSNTFTNELRAHNGTLDIQAFNQNTGNFVLGSDSTPNPGVSNGILVGTGILTPTNTDMKAGTVSVVIAGTTELNKNGFGTQTVNLTAANTTTGLVNVNAGTLAVTIIADGGIASGLGASSNDANNLRIGGNATLAYIGTGGSTNRLFQLNGDGGIASSGTGSVQFTNTGALNTGPELRLSGTNTLANSFAPLIGGNSRLLKANAGQWVIPTSNSYTGSTTIAGGTLTIGAIANGGVNSPIGASTSDGANLIIGGGGWLKYTGNGSTDRAITLGLTAPGAAAGNGGIDASGTGPLTFTATGPNAFVYGSGTGNRNLNLAGTNTGNNSIAGDLTNANAGSLTGVNKSGAGKWILSGANTYTSSTVVNGGSLQLNLAAHGPVLSPVGAATTAFADVQAGNLVLDYNGGSTVAPTVLSTLTTGYANADKFSVGQIRSTTDSATIGLGWVDNIGPKQVHVKRTYYGDATMDGQVDVGDLGVLASNWQTSQVWAGGDFDYNGTVDVNDLGLLASNWQAGVGSPLGPSFNEAAAAMGLPSAAVPEPASLGLIGIAAWSLKRPGTRRRRA